MNYSILDPRRPMVHPGASAYRRYDLISERTQVRTWVHVACTRVTRARACILMKKPREETGF